MLLFYFRFFNLTKKNPQDSLERNCDKIVKCSLRDGVSLLNSVWIFEKQMLLSSRSLPQIFFSFERKTNVCKAEFVMCDPSSKIECYNVLLYTRWFVRSASWSNYRYMQSKRWDLWVPINTANFHMYEKYSYMHMHAYVYNMNIWFFSLSYWYFAYFF